MLLTLAGMGVLADDLPSVSVSARASWVETAPVVQGPLSAEEISAGLSPVKPMVQACFGAVNVQRPEEQGVVTLTFAVGAIGVPSAVQARSADFEDRWFLDCLQSAVSLARFPTATSATQVTWGQHLDLSLVLPGGDIDLGARDAPPALSLAVDWSVLGALDKALIGSVIQRHSNEIRACYQRALTKNPDLKGKVTEKFVIARDGSVSKAETKSTTLNSEEVEGCINSRFLTFAFPQPKGGGIVIVSYPFTFAPG